ncbi:SRPBCC family protein [Phytoactinopolyspora halotolerans]|uniref:SRPBCC family protein n=1 Tax=Phytoactinopolyspora halotolerans TaxID=1981512 RepID=A0A6L9SC18_9ACTN|nr:SRPBCC family protein [Phytoactinopolyspora halotolerans]NEE02623.1 SRPBCC family protein [Phytoactinopolyspora halotolerans]
MSETEIIVEPNRQDIIHKHTFDAPRDLVFRAITEPELVPQWWGPRDLSTEVDVMDARTGGRWRFINRDADGNVYAFSGVFHEVTASERVVQTFEFEGMPGHVALETLTLEEADGKTTYVARTLFQSVEDRDGAVQSGMTEGAQDTMDRLSEVIEKLR